MKFTDVTGRVYGGTVKASGNYDIDTRAYNIHLAGKKLDSRYPAKDAAIFCYVDLEGDIRCDGNPKEIISEGTFTSGSGYYKLIPFKKIQGAFHNRGKELDFYDVSIETALGTFSTDAFHIRNGKLQLGDITLTNDRGGNRCKRRHGACGKHFPANRTGYKGNKRTDQRIETVRAVSSFPLFSVLRA